MGSQGSSARLVRFQLTPARGTRVAAIARLAQEPALGLGAPSARVWRNGRQVEVVGGWSTGIRPAVSGPGWCSFIDELADRMVKALVNQLRGRHLPRLWSGTGE